MNISKLANLNIDDVSFSVVDVETTGMSPEFNRVMDIGIVKFQNGRIVDEWESLVDPEQGFSEWITYYTRLTYRDVRGKPTFADLGKLIFGRLENSVFVAHNASFDYPFIKNEFYRLSQPFSMPKICTVLLGRKIMPFMQNVHLDALAEYFEIDIVNRHRALPDARATALILGKFLQKAKEEYGVKTFLELEKLQHLQIHKKGKPSRESEKLVPLF